MKKLSIYIVLGIIGLVLFVGLYKQTYPVAAVDLKLKQEEAVGISRTFLKNLNISLDKYTATVAFTAKDNQALYLQSVIGIKETNRLIRKDNFIWLWSVRWFKELEKEEFYVEINPETGKVEGFSHDILDEAEGANLMPDAARPIAQKFLESQGYDMNLWNAVDASQQKQKNRTDHYFEWEKKDYKIAEATLRVAVGIQGDRPDSFYRYIKVPEKFGREYQKRLSYGQVLSLVSMLLTIFIFLSAFISLIILIKRNQFKWQISLYSAWFIALLALFEFFNALPLLWFGYDTTMTKAVFFNINFISSVIGTVIFGLVVFLFGAVGFSLSADVFSRDRIPLISAIRERRFSFRDNPGIFVGYLASFFFLGTVALFYYLGTKYWGVWIPMESKYSNMFGTHFPFLNPLTVGATAAISEEFTFRLFAIAFIKKYFKKDYLAIILPALIWAFAHSSYAVFPAYMRGIELTFVGIVMGYLFLKFGLETVIIAHYSINAILVSVPLLESKNLYYQLSGIGVILLAFVPAAFAFIFARRRSETVNKVGI